MRSNDYDDSVAEVWDQRLASMFHPAVVDPAVDRLVQLAGHGRVLEFGIGTGRLALPLLERGVRVEGIEFSAAMVSQLRKKRNGHLVPVVVGDFLESGADGSFQVVFLAFSTLFGLATQDEQVRCFQRAACQLAPGGVFVVEAVDPDIQRLPVGERTVVCNCSPDKVSLEEYDLAEQTLVSRTLYLQSSGVTDRSIKYRYAWPCEMDLMARIAGLRLLYRWESWDGGEFTADSRQHVSVWIRDSSPRDSG